MTGMATTPLDRRINYRLNRISDRWSALVVSMARAKYRLNPAAMKVLSVIACYQPISPGELIERTSSDSPKVARNIGYLTEQGLIERIPDQMDGRRALVRVTTKGAKVNADIEKLSNLVEKRITSALTESELKTFYRILDTIEVAVHQQLGNSSWMSLVNGVETGDE